MTRSVQLENSVRIISWIILSFSGSIDEVASSKTRIFRLRSSARARHINWRCPADRLDPPLHIAVRRRYRTDRNVNSLANEGFQTAVHRLYMILEFGLLE